MMRTTEHIFMANDLVNLNDQFHELADKFFDSGNAGIDEFESCQKALEVLKEKIERFEDLCEVKVVWDSNYTFNLYITDPSF